MNKKKTYLIVGITLLVITIGATFAYFIAQTGAGAKANANITADTVDDLKFSVSKESFSLSANQFNFAQGSGNLSDSVTATASLKANSTKSTATYNYYVYFQIESNSYIYTTTDKKPEIVLSITGPNGEVKSVDGLTYVTASDADGNTITGFDITELKSSVIKIADSYEISSSSSTNYTNQDWTFKVTFVNLNDNQTDNEGNSLTGKVLIQKEKMKPTLAEYIISQYTGTQGENNIYYHDSSLTNGAEDNSYRYAGASADVNNYICLGSSEATCPADNLYRIIGVFGDNNHGIKDQQLVKVIKNTSIGNIAWNTTENNDWASASLNETLNTTFKTEKLSGFEDKIAEVSWRVSGYSTNDASSKTVYTGEITNATKKHTSKIGLMYPSDYGYATTQDYWTTNLYKYDSAAKNTDWLFLGSTEWLLSPYSSTSDNAWRVNSSGSVYYYYVTDTFAVRPSFYLLFSVNFAEGDGSAITPYRVT